jgi:hypothetical protein
MSNSKGIKQIIPYGAGEAPAETLKVYLTELGELTTTYNGQRWPLYKVSLRRGSAQAEITTYKHVAPYNQFPDETFPRLGGYHPCPSGDLLECLNQALKED